MYNFQFTKFKNTSVMAVHSLLTKLIHVKLQFMQIINLIIVRQHSGTSGPKRWRLNILLLLQEDIKLKHQHELKSIFLINLTSDISLSMGF